MNVKVYFWSEQDLFSYKHGFIVTHCVTSVKCVTLRCVNMVGMQVVIFILILSTLILIHELGHFIAARKFDMEVEEFGIGFPPRAKKLFTWKGTLFSLNWLPIGGFVKIKGENYEAGDESSPGKVLSLFWDKPIWQRAYAQ